MEEQEYRRALEFAVRSLSAKSQHSQELKKKLYDRGMSSSVVEQVLSELERLGYLNDDEWLDFFVRSQTARRMGPGAIEQKLRMKSIPFEECRNALSRYQSDEVQEEAIRELLKTKYRSKDMKDLKERQQVISGLARRGFCWELIQRVLFLDFIAQNME